MTLPHRIAYERWRAAVLPPSLEEQFELDAAVYGTACARVNATGRIERVHPHLRGQSDYRADVTARWRTLDAYITRPFTAADSVRPEHLWGVECVPTSTTTLSDPSQVVTFGPAYYLQADGSWRELTAEEQVARDAAPPSGYVTVTTVDRDYGTFTLRGTP